ncbi:MAG: AMP-binding protein [Kineosporiaceae bacterium]|nr:AMP-binding protein [Aeromicrobium sp.]
MDLTTYADQLRELQNRSRPAGTPSEVTYPLGEITIPRHVEHWAATNPERKAIVFEDRTVTYAELDQQHRRLAGWLSAQGVESGDRVAVHLSNSIEFVVAFLAILRVGAVHVPVNPMFQAAELAHEITDAEPSLIITSDSLAGILDNAADHFGPVARLIIGSDEWATALSHDAYVDCADDLDALAALNYTGGTTGLPKGCCHSQRHMLYTVASSTGASAIEPDGHFVGLCYLPIFWIAGEDLGILFPLVLGGTTVLMPRWNAPLVIDAIEQHRVTLMVGTVENYLELMELPGVASRDLSSLTDPQAVSFVRKMTPEVRRQWSEVAPGPQLRESAYGMTETHTMDCVPYGFAQGDHDLLAEPVFCGLPVPGTDVAVVSFESGEPLPLGEVGEIIVRSPSVTTGYWRNQSATDAQLRDGWIHTGDNGRIDELGCLHYLGREKEMIKVKGMSVFPAEIEMLLSQHPKVSSVAVVPADDAERGQMPVAFVIAKNNGDLESAELEAWARDNMAIYKVPRVSVVDAFPMTDTGKVRKHELASAANDLAAGR